MSAVATTTDKRFRRAHVKPSRKRPVASRYSWLAVRTAVMLVIVGYAAYRSVALSTGAPALQISHMTVRGQGRLSTGEVLALVEGLRGRNIL